MSALLDKTQKKIESGIPEQFRKIYLAIVANGKKLLWSKETHTTMKEYVNQGIQRAEDIPSVVAAGIRGVIRMLLAASKTKPDPNEAFYGASYPAAMVLACDALEFVEAAKKIPITNEILAETTKEVVAQLNAFYGIKKETIDVAMTHAQKKHAQQAEGGEEPEAEPATAPDAVAPAAGAAPVEPEV